MSIIITLGYSYNLNAKCISNKLSLSVYLMSALTLKVRKAKRIEVGTLV